MTIGAKGLMPDRGDGACEHLEKDNKTCSIYEDRPLLCKVDELFERMKVHKPGLDQKAWNIYNTKICHELIDELKLDSKYKIDLDEYME
jgi:Fe-S-cluster containining protein